MVPVWALLNLKNPRTIQEKINTEESRAQKRVQGTRKDKETSAKMVLEVIRNLRLFREYMESEKRAQNIISKNSQHFIW